jgi:hypothetical protein
MSQVWVKTLFLHTLSGSFAEQSWLQLPFLFTPQPLLSQSPSPTFRPIEQLQ